ncbi:hypothetical protein [Iamia sp.]|uniref:hypothetical protein n=1 Tax=Iamia sp. TaxID=2722710 RepID=UPI002C9E78BB|nr:hypothetical protein [Iamia sp.]HXH57369.1 hypothetical protein [Iamia sp.]
MTSALTRERAATGGLAGRPDQALETDSGSGSGPPELWWRVTGPGLLVAAVCVFVGLDRASLWRDEAYTLGAVHQLGPTLRETSATMGLYYAVLSVWATVSDSIWWMRALSALFALGALALLGRLATGLVGSATARRACLFLGLSVLFVRYAQEARSYALVLLLTTASWLVLHRALAATDAEPARARRLWWLHTVLCTLMPLGHGLAALQVLAQPAALLAGRADRRAWVGALPGVTGSLIVTAGLLTVGASDVGNWIQPLNAGQIGDNASAFTSSSPPLMLVLVALIGVGAVLALRRARSATPGRVRTELVIPVAWAVVPPVLLLGLSIVRPSLVPRYLIGSTPGVALLLALACRRLDDARGRVRLPLAAALTGAVLLVGQIGIHGPAGDDWRAAARTVAARAEPGDRILLAESEVRPAFEAAWREVDDPPALPLVNSPRPLGEVLRIEPLLADEESWIQARDIERVWLVDEERAPERVQALDFLTDPATGEPTHRLAGTWNADTGVTAHLLVRVDAPT